MSSVTRLESANLRAPTMVTGARPVSQNATAIKAAVPTVTSARIASAVTDLVFVNLTIFRVTPVNVRSLQLGWSSTMGCQPTTSDWESGQPDFRFGSPPSVDRHCQSRFGYNFGVYGSVKAFGVE